MQIRDLKNLTIRDKGILCGLFLSKYDRKGLDILGFQNFTEAFNCFSLAIGVEASSIKNYRDEFDPHFPNNRKGWRNRDTRKYCLDYLNKLSDIDEKIFVSLIKSLLIEDYDIHEFAKFYPDEVNETFAKRLMTGKSAEEFFKSNYQNISCFEDYKLIDTTHLGCGFDFKLEHKDDYFCVEVKGLSAQKGTLTLTEKEYMMAERFSDRNCLYTVVNFCKNPEPIVYFNPHNSKLNFELLMCKDFLDHFWFSFCSSYFRI
jgi:hypothetical protein